jgi:hypothetical protein
MVSHIKLAFESGLLEVGYDVGANDNITKIYILGSAGHIRCNAADTNEEDEPDPREMISQLSRHKGYVLRALLRKQGDEHRLAA